MKYIFIFIFGLLSLICFTIWHIINILWHFELNPMFRNNNSHTETFFDMWKEILKELHKLIIKTNNK
jgi:hypothetical protein